MSIVLQAIQRAQSRRAPKTASLSQAAPPIGQRGPWQVLQWRLLGLAAVAVAVIAYVVLGHLRSRGAPPVPLQPAPAEIAWMAPLPASAPARAAAPLRAQALAAAAPVAAAPVATAVVQRQALPTQPVVKFKPPTALSQPLPVPTAVVPAGMVPGGVPAAPPIAGAPHVVAVAAQPALQPVAMHPATVPPAAPAEPPPRALGELPAELRPVAERVRSGVHVYAPQRRSRMLLLDGRQLREGDDLAEGLKVDEITSAGVVLRHGALRVLSPVAAAAP